MLEGQADLLNVVDLVGKRVKGAADSSWDVGTPDHVGGVSHCFETNKEQISGPIGVEICKTQPRNILACFHFFEFETIVMVFYVNLNEAGSFSCHQNHI